MNPTQNAININEILLKSRTDLDNAYKLLSETVTVLTNECKELQKQNKELQDALRSKEEEKKEEE